MKEPVTQVNKLNKSNTLQVCLSATGTFLSVNEPFARISSLQQKGLTSESFLQFVERDDVGVFETVVQSCLNEPGEVFTVQLSHNINNERTSKIEWEFSAIKVSGNSFINGRGAIFEAPPVINSNGSVPFSILQNIFNYSLDIICATNEEGKFVTVSQACEKIWGYQPKELIGKEFIELVHPDDFEKTYAVKDELKAGKELFDFENRYIHKDGSVVTMLWTAKWSAKDKMMYSVARDGSKTKEFENTIKASEEKYKLIFYKNPQPMWIYDESTFAFLEVNEAAVENYGYTREEFLSMTIKDIRTPEEVEKLVGFSNRGAALSYKSLWKHRKKDGQIIDVEITAFSFNNEERKAKLVLVNDITQHLKAEKELIKSNERYTYASRASFDAIWDWDIRTNELYWSDSYETLFGYKPTNFREPMNVWLDKIHPDERKRIETNFVETLKSNAELWEEEYRFKKADGSYAYVIDRGVIIRNKHGQSYRMIGVLHDYTEKQKSEQSLKELNASLEKRASELASSNQELERFAYVASHDLQEPLRMVSSFLQLLQKRYKAQLDDKANEYIHFAVDGAERMKTLILDLLKYSRVNTMKEEHEMVNLNEVCNNIVFTFNQHLKETNGSIEVEELPTVLGTKTQLVQLFQNLIGNALKYKSKQPPKIKVGFSEDQSFWQFYVKDNGIGIDPRFYEKIFVIFQRLHHKDEYSGTGIGLAICKKIVDRHGGKIWVESMPGEGSTFYFTLKKNLKNIRE